MQMAGRPADEHLTYCTNVHPGEELPAVLDALNAHLPRIKAIAAPDRRFGVGLRLSAIAAAALSDPSDLAATLDRHGAYAFTLNGFPYGTFHGAVVKTAVYAPDWSAPARLAYTNRLADILAALLPSGVVGSISTVPLAYRPHAADRVDAITANLLRHVAHLIGIERTTGRRIALALEPEPCCALETIAEAVAWFETHLFARTATAALARSTGLSHGGAADAIRRHVGLCYDVCHAAVEFEDPATSIAQLRGAGIAIPKLQLSSALRIPAMTHDIARAIGAFDEAVYLHQVVTRRAGRLTRYLDLPDALAQIDSELGSEWRVHFHVPIFLRDLGTFSTTQDILAEVIELHRVEPIAPHLEVETYTWDVLAPEHRRGDLDAAIARELGWVVDRLAA